MNKKQAEADGALQPVADKKRKTWLWVLGWIFIFPVPLMRIIKRKRIKPALRVLIIIFSWIMWASLFSSVFAVIATAGSPRSTAPKTAQKTATATADSAPKTSNAELIEKMYPRLSKLDELEVNKSAKPRSVDNYVIMRTEWQSDYIIAESINGNTKVSRQLTRKDIESLDVIVVAVMGTSHSRYVAYVNGESKGDPVNVSVQKAELFYYNPRSNEVFERQTLSAAKLSKQTEHVWQTDYYLADGKIIKQAANYLGLKIDPSVLFRIWFIEDMGFLVFFLVCVAVIIFFGVLSGRRRKKNAGQTEPSPPITANKKQKLWLWTLLAVFCFPVPVTVWAVRCRELKKFEKTIVIIAAWGAYVLLITGFTLWAVSPFVHTAQAPQPVTVKK